VLVDFFGARGSFFSSFLFFTPARFWVRGKSFFPCRKRRTKAAVRNSPRMPCSFPRVDFGQLLPLRPSRAAIAGDSQEVTVSLMTSLREVGPLPPLLSGPQSYSFGKGTRPDEPRP